jgi:phasin protein
MSDKTANGRADLGLPPLMLPFGLEALMEMNRPALAAVAEVNGKVYENIATMNKSWVAFVNRRLKEDLGMPKQLIACRTVQEMYGVYADFVQTAVADYQSEFEHLSKLGKSLAEETAQAVQSRLEESQRNGTRPHN